MKLIIILPIIACVVMFSTFIATKEMSWFYGFLGWVAAVLALVKLEEEK